MYMEERTKNVVQRIAAAKAGFSLRSAKRIDANKKQPYEEEIEKKE